MPQRETVPDSAMVMPIRKPSCCDKVSKDGEGSAVPFPQHLPRKEAGFNNCAWFFLLPFLSLSFFHLFCFCFVLNSLFSTAIINHCRQDSLINAKHSGKNLMEKQAYGRVSKYLSQICINYCGGFSKYPQILWHSSLQEVNLNPCMCWT